MIHMNHQALFAQKSWNKSQNMSSAAVLIDT